MWAIISIIFTSKVLPPFPAPTVFSNPKNRIDIARIAALGVPYYSFSISWSRVFPFGKGPVNELALAHYEDVIDTCLQYGVKPLVTLYHWDLPLFLQNSYGGWLSEEIVDDFVAYAEVVFGRYGNKVSHWFTVNEPIVFCEGYPVSPLHLFIGTELMCKSTHRIILQLSPSHPKTSSSSAATTCFSPTLPSTASASPWI